MCGARRASITSSRALYSSAIMMIASIAASHRMVMITRKPGSAYGIHVSACVHARSDAASSAGQMTGTLTLDGHSASSLVTAQRMATDAAPYTIGHAASASFVTGNVNIREG